MTKKRVPKSKLRPGVHIREWEGGFSYHTTIDLGIDPVTRKRVQKRLTAASPEELDEKIVTARREFVNRQEPLASGTTTVAAFLDQWVEVAQRQLRPTTIKSYKERIRLFIVPALGAIPLGELRPMDVQRLHTSILDQGKSASTASVIHAVLRSALNDAVRWGVIDRNVASIVHAPRPTPPEMKTWSAEQVAQVLAFAVGHRDECLWRLALTTGMRRGELLGLRWIDVDLDNKQLAIRHTLHQGNKGRAWESGTPKTEKGRRSIAISSQDVEMLKQQRRQQDETRRAASEWEDNGLVFTERNGKPLNANRLAMRFNLMIKKTGVPQIRFHDLRHTAASLMLAGGVHAKVVQERLGHSNISITLDRYSHVAPSMQSDAAERLERLISDRS